MKQFSLSPAHQDDLSAMHAILTLCGEHMYRTQGMHHWYPFRDLEQYIVETRTADIYAIYDDQALVGTFYVTATMRSWYASVKWANPDHRALYLGGFGVLPLAQGRGIGKWAMTQVDALAIAGDYDALRFDGVASNQALLRFYERLAYDQRGLLATPRGSEVMVFERLFVEP
ncbi:MAG: GNAT family N-acetyltransferase [Anaerolineae bacterium]